MSVVHHAMPLSWTLSPAPSDACSEFQCEAVSPDHSAAPERDMPAQAERVSITTSPSPSPFSPSYTVRT